MDARDRLKVLEDKVDQRCTDDQALTGAEWDELHSIVEQAESDAAREARRAALTEVVDRFEALRSTVTPMTTPAKWAAGIVRSLAATKEQG